MFSLLGFVVTVCTCDLLCVTSVIHVYCDVYVCSGSVVFCSFVIVI